MFSGHRYVWLTALALISTTAVSASGTDQNIGELAGTLGQNVASVREVQRPLNIPLIGGALEKIGIAHTGNVVTFESGDKKLAHKTGGVLGLGGQTVLTDTSNMSSKWHTKVKRHADALAELAGVVQLDSMGSLLKQWQTRAKREGAKPVHHSTGTDVIKAGGPNYNVLTDNCNDASARIQKLP